MNISDLTIVDNTNSIKLGKRIHLLKKDLSPYKAYRFLKENFGSPNSINNDSYKIEWCYLLNFDSNFIEIYDWKLDSISIGIYGENTDEESAILIATRVEEIITKGSIRYKKDLTNHSRNAPLKIIPNTYHVYLNAANNLLKKASKKAKKTNSHKWEKRHKYKLQELDLSKAAFFMYLSSFEGFLNILYEVYLKNEFRVDRLYNDLSKKNIDIKFRLAPVYCNGFKVKTISPDEERFKDFHRIFNRRNDFIHANPSKSLERFIFEYDTYSFISNIDDNNEIPNDFDQLDSRHIELVKSYIEGAVQLTLDSLNIRIRREFLQLIEKRYIHLKILEENIIPII